MTYEEYIAYHLRGDAGVEERMLASLCAHYALRPWDSFRLLYFYTMTYHIPSALDMYEGERDIKKLVFRTDRRYVRCNGAFPRLLQELTRDKFDRLRSVRSTSEAYKEVRSWFFFGRYAAYLFLECYINIFRPDWWVDDLYPDWEPDENYTKGAVLIVGSNAKADLDKFLDRVRSDTRDNVFAIETSLCAVAKFAKGTRYDGYYTERMLKDAAGTRWQRVIFNLAR